MGVKLGKKSIGLIVGRENLTPDLDNQDRIINKLETAINVYPDKELNIELPEVFGTAGTIYNFQVDPDTILLSCDVADSGLWVYTISTKTIEQKYQLGRHWNTFQMVENNCLIGSRSGSSSASGVLLFDNETNNVDIVLSQGVSRIYSYFYVIGNKCLISDQTYGKGVWVYNNSTKDVTQLYSSGTWYYHSDVENGVLITGGSAELGVLLYDKTLNTIEKIYDETRGFKVLTRVNNKFILSMPTTTSVDTNGLLLYDPSTKNVTRINEDAYRQDLIIKVKDGCLIYASNSAGSKGILFYDLTTEKVSKLYELGYNWQYFQVIGNDCLISGSTANSGILLFESSTKTIKQKYELSASWQYFQVIGNDCLISGSTINSGILLFKSSTKTIEQIYTNNQAWGYFQVIGDNCLISNIGNIQGLLLYDGVTNTISTLISTGSKWSKFKIIGDECLCASDDTSGYGLYLYNNIDKTITKLYASGRRWMYYYEVEGGYLIGSSTAANVGLLLYDVANKSISQLNKNGSGYGKFVKDGSNCYIYSDKDFIDQSSSGYEAYLSYTLYYDSTAKTAKLVKYKLEV